MYVGEGVSDAQAAEKCADFFSRISDEFTPLDMEALPVTFSCPFQRIDIMEIARRLWRCRKPRSRVPGDVFPQLVNNYAGGFAISLEVIYNKVITKFHWPMV